MTPKPPQESPGRGPSDKEGVPAYSEPLLQLSAPGGISAMTPADAILSAGATSSITAGYGINFGAQGGHYHLVKAGVSFFTHGKVANPDSPNQETGIALHAASGKVSMQSQSGPTKLTADKDVTVASTTGAVSIAAKLYMLLTAGGSGIRMEGGNITITGASVQFDASATELAGPGTSNPTLPAMPQPGQVPNRIELNHHYANLEPIPGAPFTVTFANGTSSTGTLDAHGHATLESVPPGQYHVEYGEGPTTWQPLPAAPDAAVQRARQQQKQAQTAIDAERPKDAT